MLTVNMFQKSIFCFAAIVVLTNAVIEEPVDRHDELMKGQTQHISTHSNLMKQENLRVKPIFIPIPGLVPSQPPPTGGGNPGGGDNADGSSVGNYNQAIMDRCIKSCFGVLVPPPPVRKAPGNRKDANTNAENYDQAMLNLCLKTCLSVFQP